MNEEFAFEYLVREDDQCERIDKFLGGVISDASRTTIQKMLALNLVKVNDVFVKPSHKIRIGDLIEYDELPLTEQDIVAENIPLDIVYEDNDVLVVNKPSGMVVHPAPGHYSGTLVNALLYHFQSLSGTSGTLRPGIVHRIDKDTSGVLMVAKTDFAHQALQAELKQKTTKRVYKALIEGVILNQAGTIDAPIGRDRFDRKKMAVADNGKPAITHFTVLERFKDNTFIECRLETGRTHQIRVHMAYIGHPLVGDYIYGSKKQKADFGQYLHAETIGFTHPVNGRWLEFSVPLPLEFKAKIELLRNY
ncbi:MAG: RluA family pseudouridine synthase [Candidatus Izemoplasmatales bacterium]|nr:RluA family pseudouridine synthase [Candidatus Izemoplasmatales bacterium]